MNDSKIPGSSHPIAPYAATPYYSLHLVLVFVVIGCLVGTGLAFFDIRGNGYLALGFWRSIWLTLLGRVFVCGLFGGALAMGSIVLRLIADTLWPTGRSVPASLFLVRCLRDNRRTALLLAVSVPMYLVCREGSWKIGAVCAMLWFGMVVTLGLVARFDLERSERNRGALLASLFGAGTLFILELGLLNPHLLQGIRLNANNAVVGFTLLLVAIISSLMLRWHFNVVQRSDESGTRTIAGRSALILALLSLVLLAAPWAALRLHSTPETLQARNPKNVIVIGIDTLRADHTSLLQRDAASGRDYTPNLRKLAERGMVFETAISQAPWTMPSFASVLTGKYPDEHGATSISGYLRSAPLTVAEVLRESGYRTGGIVSHTYVDSLHGFDQGCDSFNEDNALGHEAVTSVAVTDRALQFLGANAGPENFFLFLHYFDPHNVYQDHAEYDFADGYSGWLKGDPSVRDINQLRKFRNLLGPADLKYLDDLYAEEIVYTDAQIGRLVAYLDQANLSDNTAIIVVTDHGEEFMERGWLGHSIGLYDELVHVPLLCVLPGFATKPGSVSDVVETRGVYDMILQYLDVSNMEIRGESNLINRIRTADGSTAATGPSPVAFSTVGLANTKVGVGDGIHVSSIRTNEWKLIANYTLKREFLYQISVDPDESSNVLTQHPEQAETLRNSLNTWMQQVTGDANFAPQMEMDSEMTESLKALGYL